MFAKVADIFNSNYDLFLNTGYLFTIIMSKCMISTLVFPSIMFLALGYVSGTIFVYAILDCFGIIKVNKIHFSQISGIIPYSIYFTLTILSSLIALQRISVPAFIMIKGLSSLHTSIRNYQFYSPRQKQKVLLTGLGYISCTFICYSSDETIGSTIGYLSAICHVYFLSEMKRLYNKDINQEIFTPTTIVFFSNSIIIIPLVIIAHVCGINTEIIFLIKHKLLVIGSLYFFVCLSVIAIPLNYMDVTPRLKTSNAKYQKKIVNITAVFIGFLCYYNFSFLNFASIWIGSICLFLLDFQIIKGNTTAAEECCSLLPQQSCSKNVIETT